jgi:hypothetical protein
MAQQYTGTSLASLVLVAFIPWILFAVAVVTFLKDMDPKVIVSAAIVTVICDVVIIVAAAVMANIIVAFS